VDIKISKPQFKVTASYTPPPIAPDENDTSILNQKSGKLDDREPPANARPARGEDQK
jgi:hypothetical protein